MDACINSSGCLEWGLPGAQPGHCARRRAMAARFGLDCEQAAGLDADQHRNILNLLSPLSEILVNIGCSFTVLSLLAI